MILCSLKVGRLERREKLLIPNDQIGLLTVNKTSKGIVIQYGDNFKWISQPGRLARLIPIPECMDAFGLKYTAEEGGRFERLYFWLAEGGPVDKGLLERLNRELLVAAGGLAGILSRSRIEAVIAIHALLPPNPMGLGTREHLLETTGSVQFAQSVASLQKIIDSGGLGSLLSQLGWKLPPQQQSLDLVAFLDYLRQRKK